MKNHNLTTEQVDRIVKIVDRFLFIAATCVIVFYAGLRGLGLVVMLAILYQVLKAASK